MATPSPQGSSVRFLAMGRLADAVLVLRAEQAARPADVERQLRLAEVSVLIGDSAEALRCAERLTNRGGASEEQRIRAATVVAQVSIDRGRAREAHTQLEEVVRRATSSRLWRCRTWAELWLLTALGDFASAADIRAFLRDLRHHVNQLGDPLTTIALHLFVAEAESRRGVIDSSVQHVRVARSLLVQHPNHWLESLAGIDAQCLAYMQSDSAQAEMESAVAMRASFEAGAEKSKLAVVANTGTVSLAAGRLADADRQFKSAMRLSKVAPRWRSSIVDGMCQLELARGDLGAARLKFEQLADNFADELAYQSLWPRLTGVQ